MSTARWSTHRHPVWMAVVFVVSLVLAFAALESVAGACEGQLVIRKVEVGAGAPGGTYTISVVGPDFEQQVQVTAGETVVVDHLAPGTYDIVEIDAPVGATIVPDRVTIASSSSDQEVLVDVTNPYFAGRISIEKITTGGTAPAGPFTFDIVGTEPPVELTAVVTPGTPWISDWLPLGTYTVTERDAPDGATVVPDTVVLTEDGATVAVTATNPYRDAHGRIEITKLIAGGATVPAGPWTIDVTGPVSTTAVVRTGEVWTSDWLPLGTYTVTERNAPTGATVVPSTVMLTTDGAVVRVVVTNPAVESEGGTTTTTVAPTTVAPTTIAPTTLAPTTTGQPRVLAATGAGTGTPIAIASVLVVAGVALAAAARRTAHR